MIAAAIVCAAVMGQAAQFAWKAANVKDIDGVNKYTGLATLYLTNEGTGETKDFSGSMSGGVINTLVGDGSSADAGFVKQGSSYSAYYTMTDANGNIFTSSTKTGQVATSPSNFTIQFGNTGAWTAAPVPEPTSGLLLLLGVAGMALRRRRA